MMELSWKYGHVVIVRYLSAFVLADITVAAKEIIVGSVGAMAASWGCLEDVHLSEDSRLPHSTARLVF